MQEIPFRNGRLVAGKNTKNRQENKLPADVTAAISIARVICIFFMTYVHLYFFDLLSAETMGFQTVKAVMVDLIGRSSVPLLSVISGFLILRSIERHGIGHVLRKRYWVLVLPMVIWNLVWMTLVGPTQPIGPQTLLNDIFALWESPAAIYLGFLRDIFVLSLMTPLLIWMLRRAPWLTFAITTAIYVLNLESILILRPMILFFFVIGLMMAVRDGKMWRPTRPQTAILLVAFGAIVVVQVIGISNASVERVASHPMFETLLRRPVIAALSWVVCLRLATLDVGPWLQRNSDGVFLFFLSHGISFAVVGSLLARIPLFHHALPYMIAWLLTPAVVFMATIYLRQLLLSQPRVSRKFLILEGRV